ncbi:ABCA2-like protein [Mya arenaria]|uniref:ABCA2-like protein n=1 Tax=Mya arenaria TaxID=6604 RepID=A0ABY7FTK0_MYAAR|nr:ABCA2-like protein [Mya arenaria]
MRSLTMRHVKFASNGVGEEDVDVATERKRVTRGTGRKDLLRLENLTKVYKTRKMGHHLAVDKMCIGVPEGECFGLLGVNGAGKTTTFKMLTGDLRPTSGDAYLNRYSMTKDMLKVQQNIGYCPQFDALFDELTAREHIQLYSRLRGVPPSEENQIVEWALKKLNLTEYQNKLSGTYSGGNKRKLSTAIALIGHPPLIFMDEPTTGMDPHSRRFLWDLILNLIKDGRSIILTSHSMEECEALCTRLAIMVNGQFKCLGSIQHLKNKFGDGYTLSLRLKGPEFEHSQTRARRFILQNFPAADIKECHHNLLQFELKSQDISLSYVFSKLEEAQTDLNIEDYSVSQNTLDNVFINFVKQQVEKVQESEDSTLDIHASRTRSRAVSSTTNISSSSSQDDEMLSDLQAEVPLETEDDDVPLLGFGGAGLMIS